MPRIFDNIELGLLPTLRETLILSDRSDFRVGYFNLRGWKAIDDLVEKWPGGLDRQCRLLVGMQRLPQDDLRTELGLTRDDNQLDNQTALRLKRKLAEEFRDQLVIGVPNNADEAGLRRLARQIKAEKLVVKLFLRHPLHAKLYVLFRTDPVNPIVSYLGSSNLTLSGLFHHGELNVDVLDHDAANKLARWFEDRWNDRWCLDISAELVQVIEDSWAREVPLPPYQIYVKMAYHLAQEARAGVSEFRIPTEFGHRLFEYQVAAVKIAAHHLNKRGGVLIGDVVGLGKTLMATALAKIFQDDHFTETLIICPKNLVKMWEDYVAEYRLLAKVLSQTRAARELPDLRRYRVVLIDESQNLRNREGKRYRAIQEYIQENESKCILLSATPYNKTYIDLSNQLRLFVPEDKDLGIRPERLLRDLGETEFVRRHQCPVRSLAAFEKSEYVADWRELMRLYMVRRTRSFIQDNYASEDPATGRKFLTFEDGTRSFFPERVAKTVKFQVNERDPADQYARLYGADVVAAINALNLPRYGLANYVAATPHKPPTPAEAKQLADLSRAGKRLMGFCRTNLFKRLESGGEAFQQSIERHILRNCVYLHAIEKGLPIPIGTQDAGLLDAGNYDEDMDDESAAAELFDDDGADGKSVKPRALRTKADFKARAAEVYEQYATQLNSRFKWLRSDLFVPSLGKDLAADAASLSNVLKRCGDWEPETDAKLEALFTLLTKEHSKEKVIVFTQFADTVRYLESQLRARGLHRLAGVTGSDENPTGYAWRFSPESNRKRDQISSDQELRVLLATDVLSEGQNLQDASIVVNFDLPWANANYDEVKKAIMSKLDLANAMEKIAVKAADLQQTFDTFRQRQIEGDGSVPAEHKQELRQRLKALDEELNRHLAAEYGVKADDNAAYAKWLKSHEPFHWFIAFYRIMSGGGFDVIIGNPPYVEYRHVSDTYRLPKSQYASEPTANLYAFCMERSCTLLRNAGWFGMIVPAGVLGLDETLPLREVLANQFDTNWFSTYAIRPSKLFEGVDQRLCICLETCRHSGSLQIWTTRYQHWNVDERPGLFPKIEYILSCIHERLRRIPQIGGCESGAILQRLELKCPITIAHYASRARSGFVMHYHRSPRYWIRAMDFEQYFKSPTRTRSVHHFRDLYFADNTIAKFVGGLLNSTLFFLWFLAVGNGRNVTGTDVQQMPLGEINGSSREHGVAIFDCLMRDYKKNSFIRTRQDCEFQEFRPSLSKGLLDEVDRLLARHYGFTEDELDFIINYDIKYRLGGNSETEDE